MNEGVQTFSNHVLLHLRRSSSQSSSGQRRSFCLLGRSNRLGGRRSRITSCRTRRCHGIARLLIKLDIATGSTSSRTTTSSTSSTSTSTPSLLLRRHNSIHGHRISTGRSSPATRGSSHYHRLTTSTTSAHHHRLHTACYTRLHVHSCRSHVRTSTRMMPRSGRNVMSRMVGIHWTAVHAHHWILRCSCPSRVLGLKLCPSNVSPLC
mmetsp:Transcript_10425/g.13564  ORF Transcript_10425/g.13564 Transcript_10425/m.13564 type:complete len:207 (+) Transcript_10425:328-948(+)